MPASTANDILEVLGEDHQEIGRRFAAMADVPSDRLAETFWRLIEILVHHEVAEEIVVYPALRKLPGGSRIADARTAEQSEMEHTLVLMDKLVPKSVEFAAEVSSLEKSVLEHARLEEAEVFPILLSYDVSRRLRLAERYEAAKCSTETERIADAAEMNRSVAVLGSVAALVGRVREAASGV